MHQNILISSSTPSLSKIADQAVDRPFSSIALKNVHTLLNKLYNILLKNMLSGALSLTITYEKAKKSQNLCGMVIFHEKSTFPSDFLPQVI